MRTQGKITHWNEQKGYGFITPAKGAKQVFVHVRAFKNRQERPALNQLVSFTLSTDNQGRPCAANVTRAGEKQPRETGHYQRKIMILLAFSFITVVGLSVLLKGMHIYALYLYLAASSLAFVMYAKDKSAAQRNAWRTPESTLHLLALLGGWPGALIAQQTLRHKSRKEEFRFVFWLTVIINCGIFAWLFTTRGSEFLRLLIVQISAA